MGYVDVLLELLGGGEGGDWLGHGGLHGHGGHHVVHAHHGLVGELGHLHVPVGHVAALHHLLLHVHHGHHHLHHHLEHLGVLEHFHLLLHELHDVLGVSVAAPPLLLLGVLVLGQVEAHEGLVVEEQGHQLRVAGVLSHGLLGGSPVLEAHVAELGADVLELGVAVLGLGGTLHGHAGHFSEYREGALDLVFGHGLGQVLDEQVLLDGALFFNF